MTRVTLVVLLVALAACRGSGGDGDATGSGPATSAPEPASPGSDDVRVTELEERRTRWEENQPASYRFTVEAVCFCIDTFTRPRTMTVEAGEVVSEDPAPDETADPERVLTVDDLFDRAGRAIDEADAVEIGYDNDFDFPDSIVIDELLDAIDDEITYLVTSFEVVES